MVKMKAKTVNGVKVVNLCDCRECAYCEIIDRNGLRIV